MNLAIVTIEWFQHLFLPKDHSGSPTTSIYTPWSKKEAKAYLTSGWGEGAITEFNLEYLYGPEPEWSLGRKRCWWSVLRLSPALNVASFD